MTLLAVAWDVDGTLVDSEPSHHRALVAGCRQWAVDVSDLPEQAFRGIHMKDVWLALLNRFPRTLREQDWLEAITDHYVANRSQLQAMPQAVETVRALADLGITQVCVSNSARPIVDANLDALGLASFMAFSISLDDVREGKPSPEPYAQACRRLDILPSKVLAVEDSLTGAKSAWAAGLVVAGYGPDEWNSDQVRHVVTALPQIIDCFSRVG